MNVKREYRRHLPHQIPEGMPIFLTWNLKGAMPREVVERLERERQQLQREPPQRGETARQRALRHGKMIFAKADEFFDRAATGPLDLRDPAQARIVEDSILFGAADRYELLAWCVMANHVHVVLTPVWELAKVTQGIKGYTAWKINRLKVGQPFQADLNKTRQARKPDPQPFQADGSQNVRLERLTYWQDESFDHWARDDDELLRIIHYIDNNPVKAGLCRAAEDWPFSSARLRDRWPVGQPFHADFRTMSGWKA